MNPSCTDCRLSQPYDAWMEEPQMCAVKVPRHMTSLQREKYGDCGPEGKLWEARQ